MAERLTGTFRRLFDVRLLHHYWLDDGATVFDQMADAGKRTARLLGYDRRPLFDVVPTSVTNGILNGAGCVFRDTALGFIVGAPASAVFADDTVLTFVVSVRNPEVFAYTALTWRPQRIVELFDNADTSVYRYKSNVPVLSNLSGSTRGSALFLSRDIPGPASADPVESMFVSGTALMQLTSDNPSATAQQVSAQVSDLPVFVHQADAPLIAPPAGLTGVPSRGVRLTPDIGDHAFAVITLTAVRADDAAFSFVDGAGRPKATPPVYDVRFKNRSTVWTYVDQRTHAVQSVAQAPVPLTHFGNAGTQQKPTVGSVSADMVGTKVTRLVSHIYV